MPSELRASQKQVHQSTLILDNKFARSFCDVMLHTSLDYLLVTNSDGPGQLFSLSNFVQQVD